MLFVPKQFSNKEKLLEAYLGFLRDRNASDRTLYVSGPISKSNGNSVEENIGNLNQAAARLEASGHYDVVIDPSAVGDLEAMGYSRADALYVWLSLLRSGLVGIVAMLPGWEDSYGASIEHDTAKEQGLKIIYL